MCYRGHNYEGEQEVCVIARGHNNEGDSEQEVCVIGDIIMRVNKRYVL